MEIALAGLTKRFGAATVLSDVALRLRGGRVHALMGENGAGKSTLIRVLAGVLQAEAVTLARDGQPLPLRSPRDAAAAGFRFIHQELNVVPQLSVAENVLLGHRLPRRLGVLVDWRGVNARAEAALAALGVTHIDVRRQMGDLGMGDRMLARIAAALVADGSRPVLYVMDEPTAALSAAEAERLFGVIARLTSEGAAVLYVSHRLPEVLRICHDVTVLRDGRVALAGPVAETGAAALIAAMTGRAAARAVPRARAPGAIVATARGLGTSALTGIDMTLHAGEVLGIAAPDDGSASALLGLFCGRGRVRAGRLEVLGRPAPSSPRAAWARGIAVIPRDRRAEGLALPMPVMANMLMAHLSQPFPRRRSEEARARALAGAVSLRARGPWQAVAELSGGNQQKVLFARAIAGEPRLLLLDDPTRGVDIGARAEIHALIGQATARGCAVLVASTDLPELLDLSDRILVLRGGRQVALLPAAGLTAAGLLTEMQEAA